MESKARQLPASVGAVKSDSCPSLAALGKGPGRDPGGSDGTALGRRGGTGGRGLGRRTVTRRRGHKILFVRMLLK